MKSYSAQEIAAEFVWNVLRRTKGIFAKRQNLVNSQKLRERYDKQWKIFEECANILSQYPQIDPKAFIRFAVDLQESDYILPKVLTSLKTFSRYEECGGKLPYGSQEEKIANSIFDSSSQVAKIMSEESISSIEEFMRKYFTIAAGEVAPPIFRLSMLRLVSTEFIILLPGYSKYVSTWPQDIRQEMKLDAQSIKSTVEKMNRMKYNNTRLIEIDPLKSIISQIKKIGD